MKECFKMIVGRNKNSQPDQEFKVCRWCKTSAKKVSIDNVEFLLESQIINEIKSGIQYRTEERVLVDIGIRDGVEYIQSPRIGTSQDNILSLPKYY